MHIPVLYDQIMFWLHPEPGGRYVDGTLGGAGHTRGILGLSAPSGRVLGLDNDPEAISQARATLASFGDRAILIQSNFAELKRIAEAISFAPVQGIVLDLGLSSYQLDNKARGFSFQTEGPLDMRMDPTQELSAYDLVNRLPAPELADILWRYGEERFSRRIAQNIVAQRPIETTTELAQAVRQVVRSREKIDPATRTFMALRIYVNQELEVLQQVLPQARDILAPGGRLAIISFHSLEDRLAKQFLQTESKDCICPSELPICVCGHHATLRILTKKPVRPNEDEVRRNSRSRSAKLRVAERL
jgi:16S rRNA (cytosine1402-N4)-methyltransferase